MHPSCAPLYTSIWVTARSQSWCRRAGWPSPVTLIYLQGTECGSKRHRGEESQSCFSAESQKEVSGNIHTYKKSFGGSSNEISTASAYWHQISANQWTLQTRGHCEGQDYTEIPKQQAKQLSFSDLTLWDPTKIIHRDLIHLIPLLCNSLLCWAGLGFHIHMLGVHSLPILPKLASNSQACNIVSVSLKFQALLSGSILSLHMFQPL